MKAIMVMYDSLNRHYLPNYGCDWTIMPNFERLAKQTVTFDKSFVGSMPCMPARRELHTGRYNFLHRSWGPLEPFDDSTPEILKENGIYSHLVSDHYHYWEEGGANYHTKYSSWQISRGQEGDPWIGQVCAPEIPECVLPRKGNPWRQDWVNRQFMQTDDTTSQGKTFRMGLDFIERNADEDNWFLHIETFDPHEPYYSLQHYKDLYPHDYDGPHFDWPPYGRADIEPHVADHIRKEYAALLSMCDAHLGKVLDMMDRHDMWKDTMLIVNTDHGFLLGEHDEWAKCVMPFYNEIAHSPLFIWDPRSGIRNQRRESLVQTIDLPATLLDYFDVSAPEAMQGKPLAQTIIDDTPVRDAGLFGIHGGQVNVTDGKYVYMRSPTTEDNEPLFQYTHMPSHMREAFSVEQMRGMTVGNAFSFTKGCPTMKIPANLPGKNRWPDTKNYGTVLYDIAADPLQQNPLDDPEIEKAMIEKMVALMRDNDAPEEQYVRLGLEAYRR